MIDRPQNGGPPRPLVWLALCLVLAACAGIGPRSSRSDQTDYANAIGDAAKRQVLLNIVKIRYNDYPTFVSVSQLVAGYQLQGQATLAATLDNFSLTNSSVGNEANLTLQGTFSDNPTVTYTPLVGADFAQTLLTPLAPPDLFGLLLAGVPLQLVFGVGLHSIGSYHNEIGGSLGAAKADPEFVELIQKLDLLRRAGWLISSSNPHPTPSRRDKSTEPADTESKSIEIAFDRRSDDPALIATLARVRALLQLDPKLSGYQLAFGVGPVDGGDQIRIRTRSLIEILGDLASAIDLPPDAGADVLPNGAVRLFAPDVRVRTSSVPPVGNFTSARYQGRWYYIPDDDERSKQLFTLVMLLFALAESGKPLSLPLLTIPTG